MPELPEVQTVVNTLRPRVVGRRVVRVRVNRSDILSPAGTDLPSLLTGQTIREVARRGKRIVFSLRNGNQFYVHLGMTGRLVIRSPEGSLAPHTHLRLDLDNRSEIRFTDPRRFGGVWWLGANPNTDDMGPEPLRTSP